MRIKINSEEEYLDVCESLEIMGYKVAKVAYSESINSLKLNKDKNCWNPSSKPSCITFNKFLLLGIYYENDTIKLSENETFNPQAHYDNSSGSLFKIAEELGLNHWEFDIFKRLVRCRKKNQFEQDLQKIKDTVDIYMTEFKD